ncbi:MAG: CPBP family intramembrane glutamic endopeptidase [Acidobacteriota bacterium]
MTLRFRVMVFLLPAMIVPALGAAAYFHLGPAHRPLAAILYGGSKLFLVLWPLVAGRVTRRNGGWPRGPARHRPRTVLLTGLGVGLAMGGLLLFLYLFTPVGEAVRQAAPRVRGKVADLGVLPFYVPFSLFLALAHSLVEEYYWRRYVFGDLATLMPWSWAALLAGLAFAAHHYVVLAAYFPPTLMLATGTGVAGAGVFWCWLYRRQRSLMAPWLSHVLADAVILAIGYQLIAAAGPPPAG